jgi:ABC-2 type transport system ATP-binding protein
LSDQGAVAAAALDHLSKRYGATLAVDDVSLQVGRHEVLGLLGPNGSGKTTILRVLTGYLRPSTGSAQVDGFDLVREGRAARARVGYVPEDAALYRHMRVNEFLVFMGRLCAVWRATDCSSVSLLYAISWRWMM